MDKCFRVLLSKFVPLLILFVLCQHDSGSKSRSLATKPTYKRTLPETEVKALSDVLSKLELTPSPSISSSYCDEKLYLKDVAINCTLMENRTWHITEIIISNAHLTGVISTNVTKLEYLEILDLSSNQLHGSIPSNLGSLSHLTRLYLFDNQLHGSIPSNLGNLSSLTQLDLSDNQLSWSIPPTLGSLKKLENLDLSMNFLNGIIPASLGNLSNLLSLDLWCNKLSGVIPGELGDLSQLQTLILDDNEVHGTLPRELRKLSKLTAIQLTSNNLIGELPKEYAQLKSLEYLLVGGNYLTGRIPPSIAKLDKLVALYLYGNDFEGELPPEIFNMTNLQYLDVNNLRNPGFALPDSAYLPNILSFILSNCNIIGEIRPYIGSWSTLAFLDLSFNNLTGGIPDSFKHLNLDGMFLSGNMLNGTIPPWIYHKTVAEIGDLSENNFSFEGSNSTIDPKSKINIEPKKRAFPSDFMDEHCHDKKSKYHSLFINAGGEKTTIGRNHYDADNSTSRFYVNQENKWAYHCSGDFFETDNNYRNFIRNITCGVPDPEEALYEKARLCPQSLTYYGFCLHNGYYNVRLHFDEIVFSKDEDHSSTGKRVFDIYIQTKLVLKNFNIKEKAGGPNKMWTENFTAHVDHHLLEIGLVWAGKGSIFNTPLLHGPLISAISVTPNFNVGGLCTKEIIGIVIAAVLTPFLVLAFMYRMGWLGDRELRETYVKLQGKSYTLKQIKDATRNFSPRNEIGKGRFGIIYKAQLPDQIVAVKKLSFESKIDQIATEVYALKQLKHDNLVQLLDVYSKRDLHLLIYEYMEKGSLKTALFDDSNSEVQLDWQMRVNICLGIARGLKYLHEDTSVKIVHRNVKASNILLDGDLRAKITDLGLAKLYDEENPYKFIQEIGTAVYMAPEYAMRRDITAKIDVYSYGILLLEIVSGKSNSKREENQENAYLLNEACVLHSKKSSVDLVDKKLSGDFDRQQAVKILDLAMQCVNLAPTLRPTMSEVVSELEQLMKL